MPAPLRILQILRAPVGGLFRHVNDLTRELAARGHEVGIIADSLTSDGLTQERLQALEPVARLGIYRLPMPRMVGWQDVSTPFAIRRLARELRAQILHGHGAKGGVGARLARWGAKDRAALYTPHGGVLNFKPRSAGGRLFRGVERLLLPLTDAIVFESAFARDTYVEQIATPRCPTPVIHNGLAEAEFEPVRPNADAADFVFIGELRPVKGLTYLLEALAGLRTPDGRPATLVVAGDGPERPAIEAQIARLGLGGRVRLLGAQPARPTLAKGRCMVVPSLAESLPYVILEAASAQVPVIATRVGGVAEIFGPTAGSLLPPADPAALRAAMQRVVDHPETAQAEMRERLAFMADRFPLARMVDQIETLYRQVLVDR